MIYHITSRSDWESQRTSGEYRHPSLQLEGFIHCSQLDQVVRTANLYFEGQSGLVLLCIENGQLSAPLKFENTTGGTMLFPHVYGPIPSAAVVQVLALEPREDGRFSLPPSLTEN